MKPRLVLHPGFPKCATSTVQRLVALNDSRLLTEIGIQSLGQGFRPNNGYPEVSKVMYNPDACIDEIRQNSYPDGLYFLSNEALSGAPQFYEVLAERFELTRAVTSVREPILQCMSNFKYSGWLSTNVVHYLQQRRWGFAESLKRYCSKLDTVQDYAPDVRICALEETGVDFVSRFFKAAFDKVPPSLALPPFNRPVVANRSIGLAFAEALHQEMAEQGLLNPPGPDRAKFVKAAQSYDLPIELQGLSVDTSTAINPVVVDTAVAAYRDFITDRGGTVAQAENVASACRTNFDKFLSTPKASAAHMQELRHHACKVLEPFTPTRVQNTPDT